MSSRPDEVEPALLAAVAARTATTLRPVLNATGVVVHTNLGRAPLSAGAVEALVAASGYVDVELDLATGSRSRRGAGARAALLAACPAAEDALVVNNGAAALVLATTALAAGREVVVSRGELVEIGAGFRLPDLIESTGARLREVGTTNRTHLRDYASALGPDTGCVLKVHPSNFRVDGFTSAVPLHELSPLTAAHGVPLVADLGSGLLAPDPLPARRTGRRHRAGQRGRRRHRQRRQTARRPPGRLAARPHGNDQRGWHATRWPVRSGPTSLPSPRWRRRSPADHRRLSRPCTPTPGDLRRRTDRLAEALGVPVVAHDGRVGGGGAPGVPCRGGRCGSPKRLARPLRTGDPAVLPRVHDGCVPARSALRARRRTTNGFSTRYARRWQSSKAADAGGAG